VQIPSTDPNPTSLPPIVIVTKSVEAFSELIWLASTPAVVAPEQATNVRLSPCSAANSGG
jgi:hypothetical protein